MDKNRIEGSTKGLVGSIKEAVGKLTGNRKLTAEGQVEKITGKIQDTVGKAKDSIKP